MAEIPIVVGPGGMRDATAITSAATRFLDLTEFVGKYVTILTDQAIYYCQVPALPVAGYTLSTSGAVTAATSKTLVATALGIAGTAACVPCRLAAGVEKPLFVSAKFPRLMVRAQSTSTTYLEVKENSDGLTP